MIDPHDRKKKKDDEVKRTPPRTSTSNIDKDLQRNSPILDDDDEFDDYEDEDFDDDDYDEDEDDDEVVLVSGDGERIYFKKIVEVTYASTNYVLLQPLDNLNGDEPQILIFRIGIRADGEKTYEIETSQKVMLKVLELAKEAYRRKLIKSTNW